jgi:hypothetical protein
MKKLKGLCFLYQRKKSITIVGKNYNKIGSGIVVKVIFKLGL